MMEAIALPTAKEIKDIVLEWVGAKRVNVGLGLPEYDDRSDLWRVSLLAPHNGNAPVGEVKVRGNRVVFSSDLKLIKQRIESTSQVKTRKSSHEISFRPIPSRLILGDAVDVLAEYPPGTAQLVFTSPPYFNAKPECFEYRDYESYLDLLREIFEGCYHVLSDGRFLVVNTSPVLVKRPNRNASSKRIPVPYDLHGILTGIGFDFIDDIIWEKPEGAGWNIGRGRRFAADRQPLQYKAVSVTENVMVYRKETDKLIDWNLRNHPDPDAVRKSRIDGEYEKTNIWKIHPASHKKHPAVFPEALAERVIRYYSFEGDLVLDPFAGTGTTGRVAGNLARRFIMIEKDPAYFALQTGNARLIEHDPQICDHEYFAGAVL